MDQEIRSFGELQCIKCIKCIKFRTTSTSRSDRNRKTRRGYRGGEGSDDEAESDNEEESKDEPVAAITTGLRNLDVNQGSSSSSDVDNITSGVENLTVNSIPSEPQVDICPLCLDPLDSEEVITTTCNHKFHERCFKQVCNTVSAYNSTKKCPICRAEVIMECYVMKQLTEFETPKAANTYAIYNLLNNLALNVTALERTNISNETRALWEKRLMFYKKYIKILLQKPGLNLSMVSQLSSGRDQIQEIFTYMIDIGDDEIIDLILNKQITGLTDPIIRSSKTSVLNKAKFDEVIQKMKNHPQRATNFPNVVNFDSESADQMFYRGLLGQPAHNPPIYDINVIREAINMPDLNLHTALCLLISMYETGQDDEDSEEEETKEETIPEDSLRRFKDEIIAKPEFNPFVLCSNRNSILYTSIEFNDERTMYALLNNPRLKQGLNNTMLSAIKDKVYRVSNQKALFAKLITYLNKNKASFPSMNFKRVAFEVFRGGK
jgi:hypothetical protein